MERLKRHITVTLDNWLDIKDRLACLGQVGFGLSVCKKGRVINQGLICPHCGSDDPPEECRGLSNEERIYPELHINFEVTRKVKEKPYRESKNDSMDIYTDPDDSKYIISKISTLYPGWTITGWHITNLDAALKYMDTIESR